MKLKTHLISGAGNTFHITMNVENLSAEQRKNIALKICKENAADGFIFLSQSGAAYGWHFYNNDGSLAEMCGNATRCVGYYLKNIVKSSQQHWALSTAAGPIEIEFVENEIYKIIMTPVRVFESTLGFYCDTGVPHLVVQKNKIVADQNLIEESRTLRYHPEFQPKGTNVTYVVFETETTKVKALSYERGVEGFTQACGTGAVAAAAFNLKFRGALQTQVEMPGGSLIMDLSDLERPLMTGPAVLLGSFEYEIAT